MKKSAKLQGDRKANRATKICRSALPAQRLKNGAVVVTKRTEGAVEKKPYQPLESESLPCLCASPIQSNPNPRWSSSRLDSFARCAGASLGTLYVPWPWSWCHEGPIGALMRSLLMYHVTATPLEEDVRLLPFTMRRQNGATKKSGPQQSRRPRWAVDHSHCGKSAPREWQA